MSIEQQLAMYLQDAHAIELQALEQMRRAPKVAGDEQIAAAFADHLSETERHERFVTARLEAGSWATVPHKDLTGKLSGVGMALFARLQPDTPGKLVAHGYAYERMELAAYHVLRGLAERAQDEETALDAATIADEERAMADRLVLLFDRAVDASVGDLDEEALADQLNKYLADAHAIEQQAAKLLEKAPSLAKVDELSSAFEAHETQTRRHIELVERRLQARGGSRSVIKDAALRMGALNLGMVFKTQADTPVKLATFAYAFEHLEIAAYELLQRVARRAGDEETARVIDEILPQERAAAARVFELLDAALSASVDSASLTP